MDTPATLVDPEDHHELITMSHKDIGLSLEKRTDTIDSIDTAVGLDEPKCLAKDLEKGLQQAVIDGLPQDHPEDCRWSVLIACTLIVAITQGWGFVFGVFQPWFKQHLVSMGMSDSLTVLLPTTQAMCMMCSCSFSGRLGDRYGRKPFIVVGAVTSVVSVIGCGFGLHVRHLYVSQAFQGLGAGLVFPPCMSMLARSWTHHTYFASNFVLASIPAYAFIAVLISRAIMTNLGHRATIELFSALHAVLLIPSLFIVCNAPIPKRRSFITWIDSTLVRDVRYWTLAFSVAIAAFALLPPFVYISVYTIDTIPGITYETSVLPLATLNLFACLGRTIAALLIDKAHCPRKIFAAVIFLSGMSQYIWAYAARSFPEVMIYACANGLVGGTFLSVLSSLVTDLWPEVDKNTALGSLTIFAAPGCFFGAFIFNRVLHHTGYAWYVSILGMGFLQLVSGFLSFMIV